MTSNTSGTPQGPLKGIRILEFGGIGPGPLCASLLADAGATVLRLDRQTDSGLGVPRAPKYDIIKRGRKSIAVDLKSDEGRETVLRLIEQADALLDPFRPGTLERLGLGPDACLARNPRIVFTRITGWGQTGRLAKSAGHDINYLALTGILNALGPKDGNPQPPLNLIADMGAGAMFSAFGTLAAILEAKTSGKGQVVDAAMVDGASYLAMGQFGLNAEGNWTHARESNVLDGGAPFYGTYKTSDDKHVSIGAIEAKFYKLFCELIGLDADLSTQMDRDTWPDMKPQLAEIFATKTQNEWEDILGNTDACFAPVLTFLEAADYPHNKDRENFIEVDGISQPAPAPRFSRTPGAVQKPPSISGADTLEGLKEWGFSDDELAALTEKSIIGTAK